MRQQGRLTEWTDDRGFGFITPLEGGPRVFVQISAFPREYRRPMALDLVTYTIGQDERGRSRAVEVLFLAPTWAAGHGRRMQTVSTGSHHGGLVLVSVVLLLLAGVVGISLAQGLLGMDQPPQAPATSSSDDAIGRALRDRTSGVEVAGVGVIDGVLSDDSDGARHQRFVLRLDSGQTLLVAHNIDIAPRLSNLNVGDSVAFKGEYEWNAQGGVVHWTHHDPEGRHAMGWLKHNGQTSK